MENPVISEDDGVQFLQALYAAENTGIANKARVEIGPFSAFVLISCLQSAKRRPVAARSRFFDDVITQLKDQFITLFPEGGTGRAILDGWDCDRPASLPLSEEERQFVQAAAEGGHVYTEPAVTEMESIMAVANILGWQPGQLRGFIVLGFDGTTTPKLCSNGDKQRVIWALDTALGALRGPATGEETSHEQDSGVYAGYLAYKTSDGTTHVFACPECLHEQWLSGTLGDGSMILTCGGCGNVMTQAKSAEILSALGAVMPGD